MIDWRHYVLVAVVGVLAFIPSLGNQYAFDDSLARPVQIQGGPDPMIAGFHGPWVYFQNHYWVGESQNSKLYRPVTIWSYGWTHNLVSRWLPESWQAFPHHLINILLNGLAACLVLWMMRDLKVCRVGALVTAILFAGHALHSEVVAGIVGRAELFSFCFGAGALWALLRGWSITAGLLLFATYCSKESGLAWLPFLPCYLLVRAWRRDAAATVAAVLRPWGKRLLLAGGVPLLVFFALRAVAIAGVPDDVFFAANPLYHQPTMDRLYTAIKVWGFAVYKCVAPFELACVYGLPSIPIVRSPADPGFLGGAAVLLVWLVAGLARPRRAPLLFLSVAIFFGFSFLTSNVPIAIGTIFGERLYFIPSLGVCMLPALLLPHLGLWGRRGLVTLLGIWLVANLVVGWQRSVVWKDNQTLMIHDAKVMPDCASLQVKAATMHRWLATVETDKAAFHKAEAQRLLERAQELDPDYIHAITTEATFRAQDGRPEEAVAILRRSLQSKRLPISGQEGSIRADLGLILIKDLGRRAEGLAELEKALVLKPDNYQIRVALLEHGMRPGEGALPFGRLKELLIEGEEKHGGTLGVLVAGASFLYWYGNKDGNTAQQIITRLRKVFELAPPEVVRDPIFLEARLQLATCLKALGQRAEAKQHFELLLSAEKATEVHKAEARAALGELR